MEVQKENLPWIHDKRRYKGVCTLALLYYGMYKGGIYPGFIIIMEVQKEYLPGFMINGRTKEYKSLNERTKEYKSLNVVVDRFYIALFSTLEQTPCGMKGQRSIIIYPGVIVI